MSAMRRVYFKLILMLAALLLSVSVVLMSSYAWLVLAGNPAATGIQVAIGGGNTILTAPNIQVTDEDGTVYNYPGHFSDKLNFAVNSSYSYLQDLGNLTPVSTSNGVDWFIPTYYDGNDPEVQSGKIPSGMIKDVSEFIRDSELTYANLNPEEAEDLEKVAKGSYVYLDFWVTSPGGDYKLRVSTGNDTQNGGSFAMDLPVPEKSGDTFVLSGSAGSAAAAVRIGFLANDVQLVDDTMLKYQNSPYKNENYKTLRGLYQEPDSGTAYLAANRFTIYEPNGDYHPNDSELNGDYVITKPLGLTGDTVEEQSVRGNLTVQRKSLWALAETGTGTVIQQKFTTALAGWSKEDLTVSEAMRLFYVNELQGQIARYVSKGNFITRTNDLYAKAADGAATAQELAALQNSGATEDVYIIQLERNVPQRIRMFIWLEGQDVDCGDEVDSATFAVNIELAGSDQ